MLQAIAIHVRDGQRLLSGSDAMNDAHFSRLWREDTVEERPFRAAKESFKMTAL
jgi:hypothetical protein